MRIKRGVIKKRRHKDVLKRTKGFRMSYNRLYRRALEADMHAGQYSYAHRRHRRADMRQQWIKIISAGLANTETRLSYSKLVGAMSKHNIGLDRKVLAELVQTNPEHFAQLVKQVI
jgi:large subunit ribosomal protein L20